LHVDYATQRRTLEGSGARYRGFNARTYDSRLRA
jgi:hypothetical protein